jgi:DNA-binding transcriptional ArsR family regulator
VPKQNHQILQRANRVQIDTHAAASLRYIRASMESATSFAVPSARVAVESAMGRPKRLSAVSSTRAENDDTKFDRLVYERVRLGIMSALTVRNELTFSELKSLFDVSDGNLSAHARKLEEARYLTCTKSFEDRRPKTVYRLTALGKVALNRYLDHVEAVIKATRRS